MFIGIDGYKNKWMVVVLDNKNKIQFYQLNDLSDMWDMIGMKAEKILIDMPLGLMESLNGKTHDRECDLLSMKLLGKYNSRCTHAPSY